MGETHPPSPREHPPSTRELLAWLGSITKPVHRYVAASTFFRIINLSADIALFALAAGGVVHLLTAGGQGGWLVAVLGVLAVVKGAAYYLEQFMGHHVAFKAVELLREHVYQSLWPKAPAIVPRSRTGEVFATLTRDVDRIDVVYAHTIARVLSAYIVGIGSAILAASWVGWAPMWGALAALAVSLGVVPVLGLRRTRCHTEEEMNQRARLAHHVTDTQFGLAEVIGYGRQEKRVAQMDTLGCRVGEHAHRAQNIAGLRRGINIAAMGLGTVSVVAFNLETLTLPVLAALSGGTFRAFEGARAVEDASHYIDHGATAARRLWALAHAPQPVRDGPQVLSLQSAPAVEFIDVTYSYPGAAVPAVNGISLNVPAGDHVVLLGRSGSGKSTLVNLLQRYDNPCAGTITVAGKAVSTYTLESLRSHVVAVGQRSGLLEGTIAQNVRLGRPQASDEDVWEVLQIAGMAADVAAMDNRLETMVGESASALSGGQAQRICLARALLMRPRVLIIDEFTAHLDGDLEGEIWERLRAHMQGMTVIEVAHRLEASARADQVLILEAGRVIARGTPAQFPARRVEEIFRDLRAGR